MPESSIPSERPGPPGGRRDANRRRRVRSLLDTALNLFLDKGIEGTTIGDITRGAGVAKGSFYRYFDDKVAVVDALIRPLAEAVEEAMAACDAALREARSREALGRAYTELGAALGAALLRHPAVVRLYLQESRAPDRGARAPVAALSRAISRWAHVLTTTARERGLLRPFPAAISSQAVVGATEQLLLCAFRGEIEANPVSVAADLSSLVLDGIRGPAAGGEITNSR